MQSKKSALGERRPSEAENSLPRQDTLGSIRLSPPKSSACFRLGKSQTQSPAPIRAWVAQGQAEPSGWCAFLRYRFIRPSFSSFQIRFTRLTVSGTNASLTKACALRWTMFGRLVCLSFSLSASSLLNLAIGMESRSRSP